MRLLLGACYLVLSELIYDAAPITGANILEMQNCEGAAAGRVLFLGNEGLLVQYRGIKVLFDPFFENPLAPEVNVPDATRNDIFAGRDPFDDVSVVFVSHVHGDHFSAPDLARYAKRFAGARVVAPAQAVARVRDEVHPPEDVLARFVPVSVVEGGPPQAFSVNEVAIEAFGVRHVPIGRPILTVSIKSWHYMHLFIRHMRDDGCKRTV